jgi:hypothetical protein
MFSEGLFSFLSTNAGIVAQLGSSRGDKTSGVFPSLAPDMPTFPYVVVTQISSDTVNSQQGMNRQTIARVRFSCFGSSYGQAKKLAEAIRQAFGVVSSYQGTLTDGTVLQSAIQIPPGEVDDQEAAPHGTIFSSHLDFELAYQNKS